MLTMPGHSRAVPARARAAFRALERSRPVARPLAPPRVRPHARDCAWLLAGLLGVLTLRAPGADAQDVAAPPPLAAAPRYSLGLEYSYQNFRGDIDPWHTAAITAGRRAAFGSLLARLNVARRFGETGTQVELDAYPRLWSGTYAYLNVGRSTSPIFPGWRSGAELFSSLPDAFEASLGYRQLRFGGAPVTLFTGSVGKYTGNYWLSLRPYVRSRSTGTSASASLTVRRYGEDADNYLGARVGFGSTPSDQLAPDQVDRTSSFGASVQGSRSVVRELIGTWTLGYDREEIAPGRTRRSLAGSGGLKYLF